MKWLFKKDIECCTDGFWYDINEGYIKPDTILTDSLQIEKVKDAIKLLKDLETVLYEKGILIMT